jgi:serine/threonine protein kinase
MGNYLLGPKIGQGSFAEVRLAKAVKSDEKFAVKIYEKFR